MKILNVEQIRAADDYTIKNEPIASIHLMERAAQRMSDWVLLNHRLEEPLLFVAGPGNNGGDALAMARQLQKAGFINLQVWCLKISPTASPDCAMNKRYLIEQNKVPIIEIASGDPLPEIAKDTMVIDGMFGSGLSRGITGYWALVVEHINKSGCRVIAVDIPSGLFADGEQAESGAVIKAHVTLTLQFPKLSFMFAENESFVGRWEVLDIGLHPGFIEQVETPYHFLEADRVQGILKKRKRFSHKGTFGHAFLVAGSYQKTGAAVLAAKACLRSGVGLLTVHVPQTAYAIMQTAVPEAMLCIDETEMNYCESATLENYDVLGIGPGIGKKPSMQVAFEKLIKNASHPLVADADALNILAEHPEWLVHLPKNSLVTPHPGEFDRLTHNHNSAYERLLSQIDFAKKHQLFVILKGAYTRIATPEGRVYFNPTGNPGMATAGSGDVLTGILLGLLAQRYEPLEAALLGVYLHGLAGDLAAKKQGYESLIASDIMANLGAAFLSLRK
ncbi:MAG: NAD(P)H-hydrate dehydratase [Salinivirgaceae bacterium]